MIQFLDQTIKFSLLLFEGKSFTRTQSFQCVYTLHDKFTSEKCEIFHIVFSHCVWRPVLQMSIRRVKGFVFVSGSNFSLLFKSRCFDFMAESVYNELLYVPLCAPKHQQPWGPLAFQADSLHVTGRFITQLLT